MLGRFSSALAAFIARNPRRVLVAAFLLTLVSLIPASRFRIETQLEALLPEGAPASEDYRDFLRTFGGFEKVFVLVRVPEGKRVEPEVLIDAADELAGRMGRSPLVAEARAGLTAEDERFFFSHVAPRMPLLISTPGWREDLARRLEPEAIRDRVAEMRSALRSPLGAVASQLFAADPLGLSEGLLGQAASSLPIDPLSGAFVSRDGDAALVMLTPASAEVDPAGGRALMAELEKAYGEVRASSGAPLDFRAVGGPIYAAQDEAIFRADLSSSATGTFLGLALVMILGFEGFFLPAAILTAVAAGTVWMAAGASLELGTISAIGVGFAAALLGMGVDYGIHGSAHFRELRLRGLSAGEALAGAFREIGPGIATAAFTTAAGLAALAPSHFRLLRELGQVLSIGVITTLIATATLCAALLAGFPRASAGFRHLRLWPRFGQPVFAALAELAARRWRICLTLVVLVTAASGWGISRLSLSTDLRALRPADHPSAEAERLLVEKFSVGLDTFSVVLRGRNLGEALDRAAAARQILERRLGPKAEITSPADWLVMGDRLQRRLAGLRGLPLERAADDLERELAAAGFRTGPFSGALGGAGPRRMAALDVRAGARRSFGALGGGGPRAASPRSGHPDRRRRARPGVGRPRAGPRERGSGLDSLGRRGAAGSRALGSAAVEPPGPAPGRRGGAVFLSRTGAGRADGGLAVDPGVPLDLRALGSFGSPAGPHVHLHRSHAARHRDRPRRACRPLEAPAPGAGTQGGCLGHGAGAHPGDPDHRDRLRQPRLLAGAWSAQCGHSGCCRSLGLPAGHRAGPAGPGSRPGSEKARIVRK
jgi:predicted exporter